MIFCQQCGTSVMENQPTCPNCGAEIKTDTMSELTQGDVAASPTEIATSEYATAPNDAPETTSEPDGADAADGAAFTAADAEAATNLGATYETEADRAADEDATPGRTTPLPERQAPGGMSGTAKALIAAGVAVVLAVAIIGLVLRGRRNAAINLSADDMSQIVQTVVPPQGLAQLATNADQRKEIAHQIRQVLAIGQEARAAGYADKPEMQRQLETMRAFVLAQMYSEKQRKAGVTAPDQLVSNQEVDNFIKEPGQQQHFDQFLQDVQAMGLLPAAAGGVSDQQKEQIQKNMWAPAQVLARKATAAGVDKERVTQLMMKLQEAQVLAKEYLPKLTEQTKATDQDIDAYIAKHPELDPKQTRAKADEVLKRVKAGEDFAALAKENSTDPGSKDKGGELGWFKHGMMVKQFEDAAFGMQPGQTSDVIETQFGFHIIQTEERRTAKGEDGKDEEEVRARHILVGFPAAAGANPFGPPQSPRDQAKAAVEKEKRDKLIDEIAARQHVTVAEDFKVEAPPAPPVGSMPPGMGPGGDEDALPPNADPDAPPVQSPHGNTNANSNAANANKAQPAKPKK